MDDSKNTHDGDSGDLLDRIRLRWLALHFAGYFIVIAALVAINVLMTPERQWVVLPMVGWGSVLAVHVAWVMGLFDRLGGK